MSPLLPTGLRSYVQLPQHDDEGIADVRSPTRTALQQQHSQQPQLAQPQQQQQQQQQQQDTRHRRCRSLGTAAFHSGVVPGAVGGHPGWQAVPLDAVVDEAATSCNGEGTSARLPGGTSAQPYSQQHLQHGQRGASGWQPQRPCRSGARHQRSASLGLLVGGPQQSSGSSLSSWWGAPPGLTSGGSLLQLGGWGGALGSLVAESLGGRRPSFALDAVTARPGSSRAPSRAASSAGCLVPTCLICLDALTPEDFETGEAITQACACKGDVALRHRRCAVQWSLVKRSTICDVCRAPITNLPELPPEVSSSTPLGPVSPPAAADAFDALALGDPPGIADYLIDAVRVTWMTLVICALFFDLPLSRAFAIGAVVGVGLTAAAHALVIARRSAAAVRAFGSALRQRASAQGQGQHHRLQLAGSTGVRGWGWSVPTHQQPASLGQPLEALGEASGPTGDTSDAATPSPTHTRQPSATVLNIHDGA